MVRIVIGGVLLIAGIAARIEATSHRPTLVPVPGGFAGMDARTGWAQSTYDLVRIGSWALIIVGLLLVAVGLIGYATNQRPNTTTELRD